MPSTTTNYHIVIRGLLTVFLVSPGGGYSSDSSKTKWSQNCSAAMNMVLDSAYSGVGWAMEIPHGALQFLGNYDQCLDVETTEDFGTLYCRVHLQVEKVGNKTFSPSKNVYADICAPDICDGNDIVPFAQNYANQIPGIVATVEDAKCLQRERSFTNNAILVICIMSLLLVFVAMGTIYDIVIIQDVLVIFNDTSTTTSTTTTTSSGSKGVMGQLLLPFSLYTNIPNMLSTTMPRGGLYCINGIRFIAVTWIMIGHILFLGEPAMENLLTYVSTSTRKWSYQPIIVFSFAVDIFFVMSGLLVAYNTMREFRSKKPTLDYFKGFYFHRYLRLTPAYIFVFITYVSLFKYISDGPFWPQEINDCVNSWWMNLLYINNFAPFKDVCMLWSWSLAMEMQFFLVSPLVLLPLYYYDWRGLYVPLLMLVSSILISGGFSYYLHLIPIFEHHEKLIEYWTYHYTNPLARMGPYLIGMVTGYLLYKTDCKAKLSKRFVAVGWTLATLFAVGVIAALYDHNNGNRLSNEMIALYNALHRSLWALAISWVIFACSCGYGGIVNSILSWRVFVPFTRISYCAYLSHGLAVYHFFLSQRRMFYMNDINITYTAIGIVVVSYCLAATAYLLFEVPFAKLKMAIQRIKGNSMTKPHQC